MQEPDDIELLRQFVENDSQTAFSALVRRKLNLVYSAALRYGDDPHAAEDIVQAVFIVLARKARSLLRHKVLSGWLYQTTRLTASNHLRAERRRVRREQEAQALMNDFTSDAREVWEQIAPLLDDAMGALNDKERSAIVLRYFENKSFRDVAQATGSSEVASQVRVSRAVEKLRKYFGKRGITLSAAALAGAISAKAVEAAPAAIAAVLVSRAADSAPVTGSVAALVRSTLVSLSWAKFKLPIGLGASLVVVGTIGVLVAPRPVPPPAFQTQVAVQPQPVALREPFSEGTLFTLNTPIGSVALQRDGKILAGSTLGGFFVDEQSGALGVYSRGVMRFHPDGTLDRSFLCDIGRPGHSSAMAAQVSVLADDRIFVSGTFDNVDGQPRQGHAILLPDGRVDESFDPWRGATNISARINFPTLTYSSAVLDDGSIVVLTRPVGELAFPGKSWEVYRLDSSGAIVFPEFTNSPPDAARPPKLILSHSDIPHGPFPEVPLELLRHAVRLPGGGAILAVRDRPIDGIMRYGHLQRFDSNWQPDSGFTNEFVIHAASEISLHALEDGKVLVAGMVGTLNGEEFPGLVRLDETGAIDRSFHCETENSLNGRIMDLAIQDDGRIVICGFFTRVNGVFRPHLARLNPDGSLDETFRPPFVSAEELQRNRQVRVHRIQPSSGPAVAAAAGSGSEPQAAAAETVIIHSLRITSGMAVVRFTGTPLQTYVLQATESLQSGTWINISTNQSSADGTGVLQDSETATHPMRLYRIASFDPAL